MSLFLVDIDRFKPINDEFGNDAGDQVIAHVANVMKEGRRESDIVSRIGGDEFAALLPETDLVQATIVAERLRDKLQRHALLVGERAVPVTVSIGLAEATASMSGISALIKLADRALCQAKASGRNRVVAAPPPARDEHRLAAE